MDNYIINPSVFYWMYVINSFHYVFLALGAMSLIMGILTFPEEVSDLDKTTVVFLILGLLLLMLGILLPSKVVMYQMLASKYVTKDVAMKGLDYINNIVDKLINH